MKSPVLLRALRARWENGKVPFFDGRLTPGPKTPLEFMRSAGEKESIRTSQTGEPVVAVVNPKKHLQGSVGLGGEHRRGAPPRMSVSFGKNLQE